MIKNRSWMKKIEESKKVRRLWVKQHLVHQPKRWAGEEGTRSQTGRTSRSSVQLADQVSVGHGTTPDTNRNRRGNTEQNTAGWPQEQPQGDVMECEWKKKTECYQKEHMGRAAKMILYILFFFQAAIIVWYFYLENPKERKPCTFQFISICSLVCTPT